MVPARGGVPGGRPQDDIVLGEEDRLDFLEQIARIYRTEPEAEAVLAQIRFPQHRLPGRGKLNAVQWWTQVFALFDAGILATPYRSLLYAAVRVYGSNPVLRRIAIRHGVIEPDPGESEEDINTLTRPVGSPFSGTSAIQDESRLTDGGHTDYSDESDFIDRMKTKIGKVVPGDTRQRTTNEGSRQYAGAGAGAPDSDRVFLCHARQDEDGVRSWYERLQHDGVRAWLDAEDLHAGADWDYEIRRVIEECAAVVVFLSTTSVTKRGYVQREITYALDVADEQPEGSPYIFPARLEPCEIPRRLARWHCVDLFRPNDYLKLLESLRRSQ